MEALLLIFGQIIFAAMAPALALAGGLLAMIFEAIVAIFGFFFSLLFELKGDKSTAAKPKAPRQPWIPRKLLHWVAGILGGVGVLALAASVVFFQPILTYALTSAAAKKGMVVSFEDASGTLITGDVTLLGIVVLRNDPTGLDLNVRVEEAQANVNMWSLLSREPVLEMAVVKGVTGHVSPPNRDKDKPKKERRPFRANLIEVTDVALEIRPKDGEAYPLVIEAAQVAPFRSAIALFDLLFRSNMKAEIAGQPLLVETRRIAEQGRETVWSFENVEAERLRILVPKAPLTWLNGGTLNVRIEDRWSLSDDYIDMDWRVGFDGVEIQVPREAGTTQKLLGGALAKVVNAKGGDADLRYQLKLDQGEVQALRSGDLSQFWDVVLSGFLKSGGRGLSVGEETQEAPEPEGEAEKEGAMEKLKGLFNRNTDE